MVNFPLLLSYICGCFDVAKPPAETDSENTRHLGRCLYTHTHTRAVELDKKQTSLAQINYTRERSYNMEKQMPETKETQHGNTTKKATRKIGMHCIVYLLHYLSCGLSGYPWEVEVVWVSSCVATYRFHGLGCKCRPVLVSCVANWLSCWVSGSVFTLYLSAPQFPFTVCLLCVSLTFFFWERAMLPTRDYFSEDGKKTIIMSFKKNLCSRFLEEDYNSWKIEDRRTV